MKFRRTFRFHGLRRPRIRQTWNKYNLFNLQYNLNLPRVIQKTFFQQKWMAKALTRGYHGEHIKERQWERMFNRRLPSVVNMNHTYMAAFDGSEQAAGRGRGRQADPDLPIENPYRPDAGTNQASSKATPYMQMAFAPMERRLDIAVFRAMFASSARQARQFVVHGAVTVNGKKMIYPGYLLNPGDLFQVDVERVLYATGAKKPTRRADERKRLAQPAEEGEAEEAQEEAEVTPADGAEGHEAAVAAATVANKRAIRELPFLATRAKNLLAHNSTDLTAKRKKVLRQFVKDAGKWVAKASSSLRAPEGAPTKAIAPPPSSEIVDRLADLLAGLPALGADEKSTAATRVQDRKDVAGDGSEKDDKIKSRPTLTAEERQRFHELLAREAQNPHDPSKPYATPWRPRPYMAPFAFIPRYLEVNQNICAAVYLRHPVARPGMAEVPTPFPVEIGQLAFNWYLRRH